MHPGPGKAIALPGPGLVRRYATYGVGGVVGGAVGATGALIAAESIVTIAAESVMTTGGLVKAGAGGVTQSVCVPQRAG